MALESISALSGMTETLSLDKSSTQGNFAAWLNHQVQDLNQQEIALSEDIQGVLKGDIQNLHQVIIGMEKAQLAFQLAVQVRDRVLEGYQEVMRMQV
ncbi:flagellar hook-basal body complex protein FliE [Gynuella sunshinyii]|uniref:Flagellar hook-basal body complex protein FliE n=1 Tax=Gynuella sunshinyii YC6258 TaxID=1445510 RepID=A0A0C5VDY2_9GAMM|nr:flagellar hook-basal body complex protein FliE [Gynuella sunshinyii]AJQ92717.1 flagellar hook-basal body protein [Gynuella sunshinyii YC6258]